MHYHQITKHDYETAVHDYRFADLSVIIITDYHRLS